MKFRRTKDNDMQTTLNEEELFEAIEAFIRRRVNTDTDSPVSVDIKAARGRHGFAATATYKAAPLPMPKYEDPTQRPAYQAQEVNQQDILNQAVKSMDDQDITIPEEETEEEPEEETSDEPVEDSDPEEAGSEEPEDEDGSENDEEAGEEEETPVEEKPKSLFQLRT